MDAKFFGANYRAQVVEVQLFADRAMRPDLFGDEQAKQLAALPDIKWLVLMDTHITDRGLSHLMNLKQLERLDLEGSSVTASGVAKFNAASPDTKVFY